MDGILLLLTSNTVDKQQGERQVAPTQDRLEREKKNEFLFLSTLGLANLNRQSMCHSWVACREREWR